MTNNFERLGKKLAQGIPDDVLHSAISQNRWWNKEEIGYAITAIREKMLDKALMQKWIASYTQLPTKKPEDILIIMAGNIPLVGFFDLMCVLMAGHRAFIKLSHKDRVLMEWIIGLLKDIDPTIAIRIAKDDTKPDRVIATGSDAAAIHFKDKYREKKLLLRGTRHSIAILNGFESDTQMALLSEDTYIYSGLGCRNISMIFVPAGYNLNNIPTYSTSQKYRNNYIQNRALLKMNGAKFVDNNASCLIYSCDFPERLSTISIYEYNDIKEVQEWIEKHDRELQCIVTATQDIKHLRVVGLGEAQRPTLLDYADGIDTMKFLQQ